MKDFIKNLLDVPRDNDLDLEPSSCVRLKVIRNKGSGNTINYKHIVQSVSKKEIAKKTGFSKIKIEQEYYFNKVYEYGFEAIIDEEATGYCAVFGKKADWNKREVKIIVRTDFKNNEHCDKCGSGEYINYSPSCHKLHINLDLELQFSTSFEEDLKSNLSTHYLFLTLRRFKVTDETRCTFEVSQIESVLRD